MRVWIVESGDYEQRGIDLVAESLEAAIKAIKERYGPPYIVEWDELNEDKWGLSLTGNFAHVAGKSAEHTGTFEIAAWDVAT